MSRRKPARNLVNEFRQNITVPPEFMGHAGVGVLSTPSGWHALVQWDEKGQVIGGLGLSPADARSLGEKLLKLEEASAEDAVADA